MEAPADGAAFTGVVNADLLRGAVGGIVLATLVVRRAGFAFRVSVRALPTYVATGVLTTEHAPLAGVLAATAAISVAFGRALQGRLDANRFRLLLDGLLVVVAFWLLAGALR